MAVMNTVVAGSGGSKYPSAADISISYTGTMATPRDITDAAGQKYKLLELTSSGTLTIDKTVKADICVVGSGRAVRSDGYSYIANYYGSGGKGKQGVVFIRIPY